MWPITPRPLAMNNSISCDTRLGPLAHPPPRVNRRKGGAAWILIIKIPHVCGGVKQGNDIDAADVYVKASAAEEDQTDSAPAEKGNRKQRGPPGIYIHTYFADRILPGSDLYAVRESRRDSTVVRWALIQSVYTSFGLEKIGIEFAASGNIDLADSSVCPSEFAPGGILETFSRLPDIGQESGVTRFSPNLTSPRRQLPPGNRGAEFTKIR